MTTMLRDVLDADIQVYLIGCREHGIEKHIPEELMKSPIFSYDLVDVKKIKKSDFFRRYLYGIMYAFKSAKYIKKQVSMCDVVFFQSSPTVLYQMLLIRRYAKKVPIVYNVQDMFPGSSIASGIMPQRWMQLFFYRLQKIAYRNADIITSISEDMKVKLIEQGVALEKIKVIVNWFDDQSVHKVSWENNRYVKKYNMTRDNFYVQYAGTMGYVFDYKMVVNVAEKLRDHKDIIFQMIGEGSQKAQFVEEARQRGIENIAFLPLEKQEMVSDVYSACDVCFIPLKRGVIGNSVPSKVGLLMACKRAIVTSVDEDSDYYRMINQNNIGIAVSNDAPQQAAEAILHLYRDRKLCTEMGRNGYAYGHEQYSRSRNMQKYIHLFREMGDAE
ncbi:glycosyltransferase WbuB [Candidatus Nomurabacteria bacterium]|nr:glycosyltransferase WbuB [Candidatus Nomurabacteria bacterium]